MRHTLIYFCTVFIFILGLVESNILCVGVGVDISNFGGGYVAYLVLRLQGNKDASFFGSVRHFLVIGGFRIQLFTDNCISYTWSWTSYPHSACIYYSISSINIFSST